MDHTMHLECLFECRSGLELRHKRSLYQLQSELYVCLKINHCYRAKVDLDTSKDSYLAYRISSKTLLKNIDVHMKMGMRMYAAWVGGLLNLCLGINKSLIMPLHCSDCKITEAILYTS